MPQLRMIGHQHSRGAIIPEQLGNAAHVLSDDQDLELATGFCSDSACEGDGRQGSQLELAGVVFSNDQDVWHLS